MEIFTIASYVILGIICFIFAPFMTIGTIFILGGFKVLGFIFTFHLEQQVLKIATQVKKMLNDSDEKIILNIYGFSRGAVAAFLLCQKLKAISPEHLTINVASFELLGKLIPEL